MTEPAPPVQILVDNISIGKQNDEYWRPIPGQRRIQQPKPERDDFMIRSITAALACCVVTGCATVNPMAFDKTSTAIDTKEKSIVLMTIDVARSDGSRYVPAPFVVKLAKPGAQSKEDRQNFKLNKDTDALQENGHTVYLARIALAPGDYKLADVEGSANAFPIASLFAVPLNMDLKVKPNSVTYIGRVTAKLRERKDGEFRAGPLLPLIDQSVSGMSGGTWDVSVDNMSQQDLEHFKAAYPVLKTVTVDTDTLPPFDRAAAQRLWDGDSGESKSAEPAKVASK
jgi:hypothetical protein